MYKCNNCGKTTDPKEKQNKVHSYRNKQYKNTRVVFNSDTRRKEIEEYTTTGKEITGELNYCNDCYGRFESGKE